MKKLKQAFEEKKKTCSFAFYKQSENQIYDINLRFYNIFYIKGRCRFFHEAAWE